MQLRRIEQASVKKGGFEKHSLEVDEVLFITFMLVIYLISSYSNHQFRDLLQKHLNEVDKILADMKKSLGVK